MALEKINAYGPGDNNFTSFQETLDATRRGMAEITLSNYDNDSAPVVKVGSVFENNGAFFQVTTSDITPTGYSGISNSTTFWLYFDESATAFIYSSTAPTWNDARQGWYNGDDRALFSMYKDSGGALYSRKYILLSKSVLESNSEFKWKYRASVASGLNSDAYNIVKEWVPDVGDTMTVEGQYVSVGSSAVRSIKMIHRFGATSLRMFTITYPDTSGIWIEMNSGASLTNFSLMANYDAIKP